MDRTALRGIAGRFRRLLRLLGMHRAKRFVPYPYGIPIEIVVVASASNFGAITQETRAHGNYGLYAFALNSCSLFRDVPTSK